MNTGLIRTHDRTKVSAPRLVQRCALIPLIACLWLPGLAPAQDPDAPGPTPTNVAVTDASADPAATETLPPDSLLEARIEFDRLLAAGELAAAAAAAVNWLALTDTQFGETSIVAATARHEVAEVQRRAGEFDAAELNYLRSIELFQSVQGPFSAAAIDPTIGLGDNYYDQGQFMNAVSAFNEARTLQRRNFGLLSEDQLPVMDRLSAAFVEMGMAAEADEQQLAALRLLERTNIDDLPGTLAGIYRYARWLRSVFRFTDERLQYERAIRLVRSEYGKEHILLVEPYRELAESYRAQGLEDLRGASALNNALEILRMQPEPNNLELARTLLADGDWETAFGLRGAGHALYLESWALLDSIPEGAALRAAWFSSTTPVHVRYIPMSTFGLALAGAEGNIVAGQVVVRFDVDEYGASLNAEILEANPLNFKEESALRSVRLSRFRPRIIAGEVVPAQGYGMRFDYQYLADNDD